METPTKIALGIAGAAGAYLLYKAVSAPKVSAASPGIAPPNAGVSTPSGGAPAASPTDVIDPMSRTLADSAVQTLDKMLSGYYVVSTQSPSLNTFIVGATQIPAGKTIADRNSLVPAAVAIGAQGGFDVLVDYATGQAALAEDASKLSPTIAIAMTKDPASVQEVLHKGGYIYRAAEAAMG